MHPKHEKAQQMLGFLMELLTRFELVTSSLPICLLTFFRVLFSVTECRKRPYLLGFSLHSFFLVSSCYFPVGVKIGVKN